MGLLIVVIGASLFYSNQQRVSTFEAQYAANPTAFRQQEQLRTQKSMRDYQQVFRSVPAVLLLAALTLLFFSGPLARASSLAVILCASVLVIDGTAAARNAQYHRWILTQKA